MIMIDFEKLLHDTVDQNQNATWSGCIYTLKDLLMFVNNNQDLDTKSKVIIKRQIENEIKHYEYLKNKNQYSSTYTTYFLYLFLHLKTIYLKNWFS